MSYDYSRIINKANELIERFGLDGNLITFTQNGPANRPTGKVDVLTPIKLVRVKRKRVEREGKQVLVEELLVRVSEVSGIDERDKVEIGGVRFEIDEVAPVAPGPAVVVYGVKIIHG